MIRSPTIFETIYIGFQSRREFNSNLISWCTSVSMAAAVLLRQQSFWHGARIRGRSMEMIKLLLFISKIIYNLQTIQDTKTIFTMFVAIYMLNKPTKCEQNAVRVTEVIFCYKMRQLQTRFSQEKYNSTWHNILAITLFLDVIGTSFKWHCRADRETFPKMYRTQNAKILTCDWFCEDGSHIFKILQQKLDSEVVQNFKFPHSENNIAKLIQNFARAT